MKLKKLIWLLLLLFGIVALQVNVIRKWWGALVIVMGLPKEWANNLFNIICAILIFIGGWYLFLKKEVERTEEELRITKAELVEIRKQRKELDEKVKEKNKKIEELKRQKETQNLIKTIENEKKELIKQLGILKRKERKLFLRRLYLWSEHAG